MLKEKKTDYLVLVNADHPLPAHFEDTIELVEIKNAVGSELRIEKKTYEAFLRLREDLMANDGIQIELSSVYRTPEEQQEIFDRYLKSFGLDYANKYVAKKGCSEHHTGLAVDIGVMQEKKLLRTIEEKQSIEPVFEIIQSKLGRYGFILRYPKGKKPVTGIDYESWHFRYIDSPELAREITEKGLCFEEYWALGK